MKESGSSRSEERFIGRGAIAKGKYMLDIADVSFNVLFQRRHKYRNLALKGHWQSLCLALAAFDPASLNWDIMTMMLHDCEECCVIFIEVVPRSVVLPSSANAIALP